MQLLALTLLTLSLPALGDPPTQDPAFRPQICLNGEWQFQPADNDLTFPPPDSWDAVPIRIPSPWNVNAFSRGDGGDFECFPSYPKSWESVMAAWHRRTFIVPESMRDEAIFLRFEAVHYWADVYINGQKAGSHEGGFTPFELNVTDLVRAGEKNELIVGVKAHQLFDVKGRATYGWGSFWGGHIHGIWQDVYLIARPKVHVSDVFVMTSVQRREISVQVTLTNLSGQPWSGQLQTSAWDAEVFGKPGAEAAKWFDPLAVSLATDETKTVTLTAPWEDAVLWWPYDAGLPPWPPLPRGRGEVAPSSPGGRGVAGEGARRPHLYVLATVLIADGAAAPCDEKRTRFGFREFRIGPDGRKFQLNGVTWTGRGDAWHFMGIPQLTPAYARAWYEMAQSCNINIIRLHAQVYPEYYLDMADEMGMLIVDETALWGSAINFYYNDDFLRRARQHVRELVLRDRNHPSVVLWSVANEIYARQGDDNAPDQDWIFARYAELAQEMRALDPTREVSSDGDGDLNGRLGIFSLHYPGPDDPRKGKPCTIGESGSMFYSTPPEVAQYIGDRVYYSSNDRMDALAVENADLIEGYRKWAAYATVFNIVWYGLEPLPMDVRFTHDDLTTPGAKPERLGPYCTMLNAGRDPKLPPFKPNPLYHAVRDAFEPIRFFVKERSRMLWAGERVTRHFTIHNDILEPSDLELVWESDADIAGAVPIHLDPGGITETQITFTPPAPEDPEGHAELWLQVSLRRGDHVCYQQEYRYTVVTQRFGRAVERPEGWQDDPELRRVFAPAALYDPSGKTAEVLEWLGIPFVRVATPEELTAHDAFLRVVGAGAGLTLQQALALDDSAPAMVVFEGNPAFYGPHFYCDRVAGQYRRGFAHGRPLLPWRDELLQFWGEDGIVARAACGREIQGNVLPLVTCGDGDLVMFEAWRQPDRLRIFSELALIEKARQEPAAAGLIRFAMEEAPGVHVVSKPVRSAATRVLAPQRSRFAAAMAYLGIVAAEGQPRILICDGSQPPDEGTVGAFVANPGDWPPEEALPRLVLIGLRPETLDAWNAVLPVKLTLEQTDAVQLVRAQPDSDWGDHRDLFWIEQGNTRRIMDWAVSCDDASASPLLVTNHTDWRRWCWQGENTKTAAIIRSEREPFTPQAGLLSVVTGDAPQRVLGILVSQVRLDPTNPKSLRFYSRLLTNIGVPLRRGKATDADLTPFNMDADGFITAWLVCGPFRNGNPHDTDFLAVTPSSPAGEEGRGREAEGLAPAVPPSPAGRGAGGAGEAAIGPEPGTLSGLCIWRPFRAPGPVLDFTRRDLFGKLSDCAAYAATYVKAPREMSANLWLGSDDEVKAWLNGELIHANRAVRPVVQDSDKIRGLRLQEGWNLLLFKVSQRAGEWGLCARLVDDQGKALDELLVSPSGLEVPRKVIAPQGWTATASHQGEAPARAFDGDPATRWTTGKPQAPGMWFQLDLGKVETMCKLVLDSSGSPGDYPRGLKLETSLDGQRWQVVAQCPDTTPAEQGGILTLVIPPTALRYLRIAQTGPEGCAGGLWWSVHELTLWRPAPGG